MISRELEGLLGARVDTLAVSKHIGIWVQLAKNGTMSHNFLLDTFGLLSDAEVNNLVESVRLSALVLSKVLIRAFSLFASVRVAGVGKETSTFAPGKNFIDSTALALTVFVAIDKLLRRETDLLKLTSMLANTV